MEKTKAIAYREFVTEAKKAFKRVYNQDTDLTATELNELKERFSVEQFDTTFSEFIEELTNNIIKYDDSVLIKAYLKSVFNSACSKEIIHSATPEQIISRDFENEFLLRLWKEVDNAYSYFDYYCEKAKSSGLYQPLYKFFDHLVKGRYEEEHENKIENDTDINLQPNPLFDFNNLKSELEKTQLTPTEKYNLVNDRLFDFLQWQKQYDEYDEFYVSWDKEDESKYKFTRKYYPNFEKLCKIELERLKNSINNSTAIIKTDDKKIRNKTTFKIASKRKTDVIKILSAMYDCKLFVDKDNNPITNKQELMEAFGEFFNEDFKAYSTLLTQAKDKDPSVFYKPFDQLRNASTEYYEG